VTARSAEDVAVTAAEQDMLSWLRPRRQLQLEMLSEFLSIDSHWSNPDGVWQLADAVIARLHARGFTSRTVAQPGVAEKDRWLAEILAPGVKYESLAGSVVAHRAGVGHERLLLLGDLDTAFPSGADGGVPIRVDGDLAFGAGIADAQGGLVVMLEALMALDAIAVEAPPITVVLSGDEQAGSLGSRHTIREEAGFCRWALCMECARDGGNVMASRAHIGVGLIEATGRESHAGTSRSDGISALEGLARIVQAVDALTDLSEGSLATVTMMTGGRRRSVVPGTARAVVDLRTSDGVRWKALVDALRSIVERNDHPARLELRAAVHRPGVPRTAATEELLEVVADVSAVMGIAPPGAVGSNAAGSSAFAAEAGCAVLDGLGPPGGRLMTVDEYVSVSGIAERAALLAGLVRRFALGDGARDALAAGESPTRKRHH
jgi:glutamate carboxypeptidase